MAIRTNLTQRMMEADSIKQAEHSAAEEKKRGTLRVGSTGIMSETGDIAGSCHRKAHARSLGLEYEEIDTSKRIMFDLGFATEDIVYNKLMATKAEDELILREEEIPITWNTTNGTVVTGRPDIVVCTADKKPVFGLEIKSVHSMWTSRDVLFGGEPKLENIAQAVHYMWKLGVPYKIMYVQFSQLGQSPASWALKLFPTAGDWQSDLIEYNENGNMKHIRQYRLVYDLRLDDKGRLEYSLEGQDKWTATIVTVQDIERYFEFVSKVGETGNLGPRPLTIDAQGKKKGYDLCSVQYCPLSATCDKHEKNYPDWVAAVKQLAPKGK